MKIGNFGKGKAASSVVSTTPIEKPSNIKVAVLAHVYYQEMWDELYSYICNISEPYKLFVNVVVTPKNKLYADYLKKKIESQVPYSEVYFSDNVGQDMGGTLNILRHANLSGIKYVCKVHSKKNKAWKKELLESLLGSKEKIQEILTLMRDNPDIGLVGPESCISYNLNGCVNNGYHYLCGLLRIPFNMIRCEFIGGTMFWGRNEIFEYLQKANVSNEVFKFDTNVTHESPQEVKDGKDGMLAHFFERTYSDIGRAVGLRTVGLPTKGEFTELQPRDKPHEPPEDYGWQPQIGDKSICLFSHFSNEPRLPKYVRFYLEELSRQFDEVEIVTNYRHMDKCDWKVTMVENNGLDFGMWKKRLSTLPEKYHRIGLVNDSAILFGSLSNIFQWAAENKYEFWGLTESREKPNGFDKIWPDRERRWEEILRNTERHIQSYFVVAEKPAIVLLHNFFKHYKIHTTAMPFVQRVATLIEGEVRLSNIMKERIKMGAYMPADEKENPPKNPHVFHWKKMIESGIPLIKKKIVNGAFGDLADFSDWEKFVREHMQCKFEDVF